MVANEWALTPASQSEESQGNKHTSEGMQQDSKLHMVIMWESYVHGYVKLFKSTEVSGS